MDYTESISVIIPTYNRAHCLLQAVKSVLEQTVLPLEILVIDDGSSDDTEAVLQNISSRVRYVKKQNGGVSSARNLGIALAQGDWIAFLDSDDSWWPDKLEQQLRCIQSTGAQVCFTGTVTEDGTRHDGILELDPALAENGHRNYRKPVHFITRSNHHPMVQSLLIHRHVIDTIGGFDESLYVAEDTALFYALVANHEIALVNAPLVNLTRERTSTGLSDVREAEKAAKRFDCYIQVQARALACIAGRNSESPHYPEAIRTIRRRLAYFFSRRAELAYVLGNHVLGRQLAKEAMQLTSDTDTYLRSCLLAYGYTLLKPKLKKKWPGIMLERMQSSPTAQE